MKKLIRRWLGVNIGEPQVRKEQITRERHTRVRVDQMLEKRIKVLEEKMSTRGQGGEEELWNR